MKDLVERQAVLDLIHENWYASNEFYLNHIMEIPSIDDISVRHGKWEMKPDPYGFFDDIPVCSECGCTTKMREKTKYCPYCGARMDAK